MCCSWAAFLKLSRGKEQCGFYLVNFQSITDENFCKILDATATSNNGPDILNTLSFYTCHGPGTLVVRHWFSDHIHCEQHSPGVRKDWGYT